MLTRRPVARAHKGRLSPCEFQDLGRTPCAYLTLRLLRRRRWEGALQARLLRAPLENFLRSQGGTPAALAVLQDSDRLACAAVLILERGVTAFSCDRERALHSAQLLSPSLGLTRAALAAETVVRGFQSNARSASSKIYRMSELVFAVFTSDSEAALAAIAGHVAFHLESATTIAFNESDDGITERVVHV